ncbi:MAG: hypothetical protein ACXVC6_09975 [Bacteroidia bacterium]
MKSIKRIAVMMAIVGASIGLHAQTDDRPAKKVNNEQQGTRESEYQNPSDKKSDNKKDMNDKDYHHTGKKAAHNDKSDMNGGYNNSGSKKSSGSDRKSSSMSSTSYQTTPERKDKTDVTVPEAVRVSFNNDYYTKDISPVWKKEGENYRADFRNGSIGSSAIYDKNGKLIESERQLGDGEYPEGISSGNNKSAKVWESNRNGEIKYFTKDDDGHMTWFDKDGKHIASPEHHVAHQRSYK